MSARTWLRISAILSIAFAAGHSLGGLKQWSPMGDNAVLQMMKKVQFNTMGVNRSYFDFFMGFGISLSISMIVQACILWLMADLAKDNSVKTRPMIIVFLIASIASAAVSWHFIFPLPTAFALVLTGTLGMAAMKAR